MPRRRRHSMPTPPVRVVARGGGGLALEVDGVTQSTMGVSGGYWERMVPAWGLASAVLLGLGGGTVARLLAARWPGVAIIGVERDERIIAVAREQLGLAALRQLTIVHANVFPWVAAQASAAPGSADLIIHDLYVGGRLIPGALGTPFLRQVAALLRPGGQVAINLVRTQRLDAQLARLRRVFVVVERHEVGGNCVVWLAVPDESEGAGGSVLYG